MTPNEKNLYLGSAICFWLVVNDLILWWALRVAQTTETTFLDALRLLPWLNGVFIGILTIGVVVLYFQVRQERAVKKLIMEDSDAD